MRRRTGWRAAVVGLLLLAGGAPTSARAERVVIFAAASLTNALNDIAADFNREGDDQAVPVFAASSVLARQIAAGAPAHLYFSAHPDWMDYLDGQGLIEIGGRADFLGNRLVLIVPADSQLGANGILGEGLAALPGSGRLALGDPAHVPAGIYAQAALRHLGVWPRLAPAAVYLPDVRAVLALVARGEVAAGIVYASDAAITTRVRVIAPFPAQSHPPIRLPVALIAGRASPAARRFFDFLQSPAAKAVFAARGFALD